MSSDRRHSSASEPSSWWTASRDADASCRRLRASATSSGVPPPPAAAECLLSELTLSSCRLDILSVGGVADASRLAELDITAPPGTSRPWPRAQGRNPARAYTGQPASRRRCCCCPCSKQPRQALGRRVNGSRGMRRPSRQRAERRSPPPAAHGPWSAARRDGILRGRSTLRCRGVAKRGTHWPELPPVAFFAGAFSRSPNTRCASARDLCLRGFLYTDFPFP